MCDCVVCMCVCVCNMKYMLYIENSNLSTYRTNCGHLNTSEFTSVNSIPRAINYIGPMILYGINLQ
jgi:hypothetical protein